MPHKLPAICVVLMLLLSLNTGCSFFANGQKHELTPLQEVTHLNDAYSGALITLTAARRAGLIDDAAKAKIENYRKAAAALLDEANRIAVEEPGLPGFDKALQLARRAIDVLTQQAQKKKLQMQQGAGDGPHGTDSGRYRTPRPLHADQEGEGRGGRESERPFDGGPEAENSDGARAVAGSAAAGR